MTTIDKHLTFFDILTKNNLTTITEQKIVYSKVTSVTEKDKRVDK